MPAYVCCFNVFSCLQTESPKGHMRAVPKFSLHSLMEVLGKANCIYVLSVIGSVPTRKNCDNAEGKWNESKQNSKKRIALEFSIIFSSSFGESDEYGTGLEFRKGSQAVLCKQQTTGRRNFSGQFFSSGYYWCPSFKSNSFYWWALCETWLCK